MHPRVTSSDEGEIVSTEAESRTSLDIEPVHDHGPSEGRGTFCPERLQKGRLVGACVHPEAWDEPWTAADAAELDRLRRSVRDRIAASVP